MLVLVAVPTIQPNVQYARMDSTSEQPDSACSVAQAVQPVLLKPPVLPAPLDRPLSELAATKTQAIV